MLFPTALVAALVFAASGNAQVTLGSAAPFGIIAATAITNTGLSVVNGDVGITPNGATSITGFPPGIVTGTIEAANARAAAARNDALAAYNAAAAAIVTTDLTGVDLGGQVLTSGVYGFSSSVGLTGVLTLDGQGNPASSFIFKIGSTLITASASSVVLINGASPCNVFFQVGSSATLGTGTNFAGNILALTSITGNSGVTVNGGLYALNAAVTLISDVINAPGTCPAIATSSTSSAASSTFTPYTSSSSSTTPYKTSSSTTPYKTSSSTTPYKTSTSTYYTYPPQTTLVTSVSSKKATLTSQTSTTSLSSSAKTKKEKKTKTKKNAAETGKASNDEDEEDE